MSQEARIQEAHVECLVAAILTVGVIGREGTSPKWARIRYAQTLQEIRQSGGPVNPNTSQD